MKCLNCAEFELPAPQYEPNSMGLCRVMDRWLDKFADRRPDPKTYDRNYARLGGKPPWPLVDRLCEKNTEDKMIESWAIPLIITSFTTSVAYFWPCYSEYKKIQKIKRATYILYAVFIALWAWIIWFEWVQR